MNQISKSEIRNIEIEILKQIDIACKKNGIRYYIAYGTLLGAVRHQGFIPWDDDVDIVMFRNDYNKFLNLIQNNHLPEWISKLDETCPGYFYPFMKLVDNRTIAKMENNKTEHGIWVDVFPLDYVPGDEKIYRKIARKAEFLRNVVISMTTDFHANQPILKKLIKKFLCLYAKIKSPKAILEKYNKLLSSTIRLGSNDYVACLFSPYVYKEKIPTKIFENSKKYLFEGNYFDGPASAKEYLTSIYGNFMELPPLNKRRTHEIQAWWK